MTNTATTFSEEEMERFPTDDLYTVLEYSMHIEEGDFQNHRDGDEDREDHIYRSLYQLASWLGWDLSGYRNPNETDDEFEARTKRQDNDHKLSLTEEF